MSYFKTKSGYKIEHRYYFDETGLNGVMKVVNSTDTDIQILLNLSSSMADYCDHLSFTMETINSYPKAKVSINTYSYPGKYYAKDLETAKNPKFSYHR